MRADHLSCGVRTAAIVAAVAMQCGVASASLTIEIVVDHGRPVVLAPPGVPTSTPTAAQFGGSASLDGGSISWQIYAEGAANVANTPKIIGSVSVLNQLMVPREYVVTLRHPGLTACPLNNEMGGSAFLTLLLDGDGGKVSAPTGEALWRALIDDQEVATLFDALDFETGDTATVLLGPESFGKPIPSDPTVGVTESIGLRFSFSLSGGETLTISSLFMVAFVDLDCPSPADLNGDGIVDGADLGILLAHWGTDDPIADINGDGIVDGEDLGILLLAWTVF